MMRIRMLQYHILNKVKNIKTIKNIKTFEAFQSDDDMSPEQKEKMKNISDKLGKLLPDLEKVIKSIPDDVKLDKNTEDELKKMMDLADDALSGKEISLDDIKKMRDDNDRRFKEKFGNK